MILISVLVSTLFVASCTSTNNKKENTAEELSRIYCGKCHMYPEPRLLDKQTWKQNVLPAMAKQMGIDHVFETTLPGAQPLVSVSEWKKILSWYIAKSPAQMPAQNRPVVKGVSNLFSTRYVPLAEANFPSTSFIRIDEGNHRIYAADAQDSSLTVYDARLTLVSHTPMHAVIVDMNFAGSLTKAGKRDGIFCNIGMMNPNDRQSGSADSFQIDEKGKPAYKGKLFENIRRPVQIAKCDLDNNGLPDYLVCSFGNNQGELYWMKGTDQGEYEKKILRPLPGAITSVISDINTDGLPDIVVLMAQADEGIFLYLNQGNGNFQEKRMLEFPPVYGSSSFELVDFDGDGHKDLLYTCGDNDDYSAQTLKYYHGVYIYINDGKNHFRQQYFFPIHGCYKAIAKDFDRDGDLDIATISFFPDTKLQPSESFIYLEQKGRLRFEPFTIKNFSEGRWMTLDAGDVDGDGYADIVLGSMVPPIAAKLQEWKKSNRQKAAVLLLHNESARLSKPDER